jgi:hypothetical protein
MTFLPEVAICSRRLNKKLFLCQFGDAACSGSLGADIFPFHALTPGFLLMGLGRTNYCVRSSVKS